MVTTRRTANKPAPPTTIPAARALRRERRARANDAEILNPDAAPAKSTARRGRSSSSAIAGDPVVVVPAAPPKNLESQPNSTQAPAPPSADLAPLREETDLSSSASQATVRPPAVDQPHNSDSAQPPPPQTPKRWFSSSFNQPPPHPSAPIFKPSESLIHFAPGVPISKEEVKPFEQVNAESSAGQNRFPGGNVNLAAISANVSRMNEAISKAAIAVIACMNGHDVSHSDYVSIFEGMLDDPDMRQRLPPVLIDLYDAALQGNPTTLHNGGLVEKFVQATKRATTVTAELLMRSKNAKRERKSRGPRNRALNSYCQARPPNSMDSYQSTHMDPGPSNQESKSHIWNFGGPSNGRCENGQHSFHLPHPPVISLPSTSTQPLTEANLNRCTTNDNTIKGKNKETLTVWDEERSGVVRTSKGAVRAAPYPRRVSADQRANANLVDPTGNMRTGDLREDSRYSIYSASTGLVNQHADASKLANTIICDVQKMLEPSSYEADCVKTAEALIEETRRTQGAQVAERARRGFGLIHCYDLVKRVNVDFLADALLQHIAESRQGPSDLPPQSQTRKFGPHPEKQIVDHPEFGPGHVTFVRVFEPVDTSNQPLSHRQIVLDTPMLPPPHAP